MWERMLRNSFCNKRSLHSSCVLFRSDQWENVMNKESIYCSTDKLKGEIWIFDYFSKSTLWIQILWSACTPYSPIFAVKCWRLNGAEKNNFFELWWKYCKDIEKRVLRNNVAEMNAHFLQWHRIMVKKWEFFYAKWFFLYQTWIKLSTSAWEMLDSRLPSRKLILSHFLLNISFAIAAILGSEVVRLETWMAINAIMSASLIKYLIVAEKIVCKLIS